jgi:5-formyltetrahydrofolate cyclo-ligase
MSDTAIQKDQQRRAAATRRKALFGAVPDAGERLASHVISQAAALDLDAAPKVVSVFWSMGSEIDTRPLLSLLHAAKHITALPVVAAKASPLVFRRWAPGDALVDGGFGTSIPSPDAETVQPQILFVPLLAFDDSGLRLGYGGGFYDRTLEKLRALDPAVRAVGVAFSGQRVDTVPREPYDQPLDGMVTEAGLTMYGGKETT